MFIVITNPRPFSRFNSFDLDDISYQILTHQIIYSARHFTTNINIYPEFLWFQVVRPLRKQNSRIYKFLFMSKV